MLDAARIAHFWSKVGVRGADDCWLWNAACAGCGYGNFWTGARFIGAHRFAATIMAGRSLRREEVVCHRCDTPLCCNPAHLFIGTHADNVADCLAKGRNVAASKTHCRSGHEFNSANTYVNRGHRHCRACNRASSARRYRRRLLTAGASQ